MEEPQPLGFLVRPWWSPGTAKLLESEPFPLPPSPDEGADLLRRRNIEPTAASFVFVSVLIIPFLKKNTIKLMIIKKNNNNAERSRTHVPTPVTTMNLG